MVAKIFKNSINKNRELLQISKNIQNCNQNIGFIQIIDKFDLKSLHKHFTWLNCNNTLTKKGKKDKTFDKIVIVSI